MKKEKDAEEMEAAPMCFLTGKRGRRRHNVCAVTDLSFGASAAGPNED